MKVAVVGAGVGGLAAAYSLAKAYLKTDRTLKEQCTLLVPSWIESGARILVTTGYIVMGCIILLEDGGKIFSFEGSRNRSFLKVYIRIQNPRFYWKVATQADLGFADAYINGDISFVDRDEGLFNCFMVLIASREVKSSSGSRGSNRRI